MANQEDWRELAAVNTPTHVQARKGVDLSLLMRGFLSATAASVRAATCPQR
jgi:hypothetical protein